MRPFSNRYTGLSIILLIISIYITGYQVIELPLGFVLILGSTIMLIAAMVSSIPDEHEFDIQQEMDDSDLLNPK